MSISILTLLALSPLASARQEMSLEDQERAIARIRASHIVGNVPPESDFMPFLRRDVRAFLALQESVDAEVEVELLRDAPTQVGLSYPKYYLWVRARSGGPAIVEGAMRVAAIDRVRFEVTHFLARDAIRAEPSSLAEVFPTVLIPAIRQHAGMRPE